MLYTPESHPVIAVDLDGTIWSNAYYPGFGEPFRYAVQTLNKMVEVGYDVIIWTSRGGHELEDALDYLVKNHGLNPEIKANVHAKYYTDQYPIQSPKIGASVYLEDKAYGVEEEFTDKWGKIYYEFIGEYIK